jgi:chemotaxis protein MotB
MQKQVEQKIIRQPKFGFQHRTIEEDEHPWLLSYSDMFTLLFCFFVILISIAFKHLDWVKIEQMLKVFSTREEMSLPELYEKIQQLIKQYNLEESVNVQLTSKGVEVNFKEKATFDKGEAKLKPDIYPILTAIAKLLSEKGIDRRKVIVEGHSDSLPISTKEFPSNWELSTARAGTVVRFLTEKGLNPKRFEAVGYADTRPKVQYTHPVYGQPENRRVVIVVSPEPYTIEYIREEVSVEDMKKKVATKPSAKQLEIPVVEKKPIEEEKIVQTEQVTNVAKDEKQQITQIKSIVPQQLAQQQTITKQQSQISVEQKQLMQQYFALGQQKFKEGNYTAAIVYFKKVLEIDPNHVLSKRNIERAKKMLQQQ